MRSIAPQWLHDILTTLYQRRTATRAEIIAATNLNAGSLSQALGLLMKRRIVRRVGIMESNGGRKAELLQLNPQTAYFVALDLGGTRARFALLDFVGDVRARWEQDIGTGKEAAAKKLADGIRIVLADLAPADRHRVMAAGISYPGYLDEEGRITAYNLGWIRSPILNGLKKIIHMPMFIERDDFTSGLAERWLGRGQSSTHWIQIETGMGVGFGIFNQGVQIRGWRKLAGELGHVTSDANAEDLCKCGRRGCLEAIISTPNIMRQYNQRVRGKAEDANNLTAIFERARRGDRSALDVMTRVGHALGTALAWATNILNPELIILSGDIVEAEDIVVPIVREELVRRNLPETIDGLRIVASPLGVDVRLKGAGCLAFLSTLNDPETLLRICRTDVPARTNDLHPASLHSEARSNTSATPV